MSSVREQETGRVPEASWGHVSRAQLEALAIIPLLPRAVCPWRRKGENALPACVSGCLSGRGQAQAEDGRTDKALLRQMEGIYAHIPVRPAETSAHVQALYQEWLGGADSPRAQETLHTAYGDPGHPAHSRDIKW